MRFIAVCGGRNYNDFMRVRGVLSKLTYVNDVIVHGDANGADRLAGDFAHAFSRFEVKVPAMWNSMGKGAGVRRNGVIAALPLTMLVAFPGGIGTADMIARAKAAGIEVVEISP